jgi:acyl-coenzyme A thioesterase 13
LQAEEPIPLVTISMSIDFLSMANTGSWIEFVATPTKIGKTTCFASLEASSAGKLVARATGVFQIAR